MKKAPIDVTGLNDALGGKRVVIAGNHPKAGEEGQIMHFVKDANFNTARAAVKMDGTGIILFLDQNYLALKLPMKLAWYQKFELWITRMFAIAILAPGRLFRKIEKLVR